MAGGPVLKPTGLSVDSCFTAINPPGSDSLHALLEVLAMSGPDARFEGKSRSVKALRLGVLAACVLIAGFGQVVPSAVAIPTTMVNLGHGSRPTPC